MLNLRRISAALFVIALAILLPVAAQSPSSESPATSSESSPPPPPVAARPASTTPSPAIVPSWADTARSWEETARRFRELGDTVAARQAWAQAAIAWERDGKARATAAVLPTARLNELEQVVQSLTAELASWRRTAVAWREAAKTYGLAGDSPAQQLAMQRSGAALMKVAELEPRLDELSAQLSARRSTLIDRPVSIELQTELVDRWADVAISWEETARTWDKSGEPAKAQVARIKAEEVRARIREIRADLDTAWFLRRTYPQSEESGMEIVEEEAGEAVVAEPVMDQPVVETVEVPPVTEPAPVAEPAQQMEIPELPPRKTMPPSWLMMKDEREAERNSLTWRQGAETWRKTALTRLAAGELEQALEAVAKTREALEKAIELEEFVRNSYAKREAEISAQISKSLGEEPRSEEQILRTLDAAAQLEPLPPSITGDAIALAPPDLPEAEEEQKSRGFFDLEIGGPLPSTLRIQGRKVVDVSYNVTHYTNPSATRVGGNTQSSFNLNQELQVTVAGRVGKETTDHITIDIRYDDTQRGVNSVNNRSISVDFVGVPHKASWGTYQYDAEFGDISVSLPGSEFAFYNKSLFGVKANLSVTDLNLGFLKADRVNLILLGSQTKGVSASKEFTLSGERILQNRVTNPLTDADFAKNIYFAAEPDSRFWPISAITVYKDDQLSTNDGGTVEFTAQSAGTAAGVSYAGKWNVLVPGTDFIVNQVTAEIEFLSGISTKDAIAVSYNSLATGGGSFGNSTTPPRLIRLGDSVTAEPLLRAHELRNRYRLMSRRIKKDDPGFIFRILDRDGRAQTTVNGVATTYLQLFGFDRDGNDKVDVELIDYDFGVIKPAETAPFARSGNSDTDNNAIYTKRMEDVTSADQKYTYELSYLSDQPSEIFSLGFDIIKGSDIVYVDGVKVARDVDYFIDYEAGIITFLNRAILKNDSKIRVDYEFLPFGGQFERTVAGTRLDVNVNPRLSFGTTLLYDVSAAATEIPSILEDAPNQNTIVEIDARLQLAPLLYDFLDKDGSSAIMNRIKQNFRLDLGGEWAWTTHAPNTFGSAMVEDFEEIEEIVGVGMSRTSWQPGSKPPGDTAVKLSGTTDATRGLVGFNIRDNFGHRTEAQNTNNERQQSLQLDLSFAAGETWVAIRQPLSSSAISFQNITTMELYASGLPGTMRAYVDVGLISEDADGDGVFETEDNGLDGNPATNDAGENNGTLNTGEDVGIVFNHPVQAPYRYGVNDGALTTEDMDNDGKLDQLEAFFRLGELNLAADIERKNFAGLDNSAWTVFRAPWRTRTPFGSADTSVIKHIRLVFVRQDGQDTNVTLFMDQLAFRGNKFKGSSSDSRVVLLPRNNENDPNYSSPPRTEIKGNASKTKEQALAVKWQLAAGDSATVVQNFNSAVGAARKVNLGDYRRLSYFLAGDARNETFSLFLVQDPKNYIEIRKRVTTGSDIGGLLGGAAAPVWERIDVLLDPIRQSTITAILVGVDSPVVISYTNYEAIIVGEFSQNRAPSLTNINEIWLRVHSTAADGGELWLDDIYAAEPIDASATAQKADFATGWGDLWSLSGSWRDVPGKYRGVGILNDPATSSHVEQSQYSTSLSGTLALHRLLPSSWQIVLPLSATYSKSVTEIDPDRVENALSTSLGKTVSENQAYNTTLQVWKLPAISLNYGRSTSLTDYRNQDRTNLSSTLNGNTAYSFTFPRKLFGIIPTGQFLSLNSSYNYSQSHSKSDNSVASGEKDANTKSVTQSGNFSATSRPFDPLTLSYNFSTAYVDYRSLIPSDRRKGVQNRVHTTNAALSLPSFWGVSPGVSFSGNYTENFNLPTFGLTVNKDLALGGDFRLNVGVDPSRWTRLLSWLTARYSYSLSSNASYRSTTERPLSTKVGITDVFGDYVGERIFPWGSSKRIGQGTDGITANRSSGSTNIVHNLGGEIKTWNWLSTSYSTSFTHNEVASQSTLSLTDGINGSLNMRMDYNQAFPRSFIKFQSSYITGGVSYGRTEAAAARTNSIAPNLNWNFQLSDAFNMTITCGYNRSTNVPTFTPEQKTVSQSLSPSMNWTTYFDLKVPESLQLPGIGKVADLNRRIQLSGGANASLAKSEQGQKTTSERNTYGTNLSLGYRIATNLELSASTTGAWVQDLLEKQNDYFTVGAGARVEWRF